jgi:hypothetical protein
MKQKGQGLVEYALILVLVIVLILGVGALFGLLVHSESNELSVDGLANPVCRLINVQDLKDIQYSEGHYANKTFLLLTDYTVIPLEGWVKFVPGWYLYDDSYKIDYVHAQKLNSQEDCPRGAKIFSD